MYYVRITCRSPSWFVYTIIHIVIIILIAAQYTNTAIIVILSSPFSIYSFNQNRGKFHFGWHTECISIYCVLFDAVSILFVCGWCWCCPGPIIVKMSERTPSHISNIHVNTSISNYSIFLCSFLLYAIIRLSLYRSIPYSLGKFIFDF